MLSELNSWQLPLLHTLEINSYARRPRDIVIPPLHTLFGGALNLEHLVLRLEVDQFLSHLVFPNLTTFELLMRLGERFRVSDLLDFLKTSPLLRTVKVDIFDGDVMESAPQGMVVALPNVETFSLSVRGYCQTYLYDIAVHVACPFVKRASLTHEVEGSHFRFMEHNCSPVYNQPS